jgi:hypothetical protein
VSCIRFYEKNIYFICRSDSGIPSKQPRVALGSAAIDHNHLNTSEDFFVNHIIYLVLFYFKVPYSPPDDFVLKTVDRKCQEYKFVLIF